MLRSLTGALGALILILIAGPAAARAKVGQVAPAFTVTTFAGEKIALEDMKGQVIVLNYWATWCGPCRRELPILSAYYRRHSARGLKILAITTEGSVPPAKLKPLEGLLSFPLISRMSGRGYGTVGGAVPTNYVIDRAGVVRYAKADAFSEAELDALLGPLLAAPAPAAAN